MGGRSHLGRELREGLQELKDEEGVTKKKAEGRAPDGKTDMDEGLKKKYPGTSESHRAFFLPSSHIPWGSPHFMGPPERPTYPSGCMKGASGNCALSKQPVVPEASVKREQDFFGTSGPHAEHHSLILWCEFGWRGDSVGPQSRCWTTTLSGWSQCPEQGWHLRVPVGSPLGRVECEELSRSPPSLTGDLIFSLHGPELPGLPAPESRWVNRVSAFELDLLSVPQPALSPCLHLAPSWF